MSCAPGDTLLSGGPASVAASSVVLDSFPYLYSMRIRELSDSRKLGFRCTDLSETR